MLLSNAWYGGVKISEKVRTSVYVDPDLFVLGRGAGINFSEVLNIGLAAALGVQYEKKDVIRQKRLYVEQSVKDRFAAEKEAIMAEEQAKVRENEERERVHDAIMRVVGSILDMARRRLYDPHGDYIEWWEELARRVSKEAGTEISVEDLQAFVRHG